MGKRRLLAEIHELRTRLRVETEARHDAEIRAARATGELTGYRRAVTDTDRDARAAARNGMPLLTA